MPYFRNRPVDIVLDVRTKLEYWMGHLPGAIQIPVDALEEQLPRREDIGTGKAILVYCASGARSAQAAAIMKRMGYKRVTDAGGIAAARAEFSDG
ncbi:MAG TPA: rhodanese-like domain-containing protein [Gemmatimonadaceae bacterium]